MAWNIKQLGNSATIKAGLTALAVSTANAGEVAQVAAVKNLLVARLPDSGNVELRAAGSVTAANQFQLSILVIPVTVIP